MVERLEQGMAELRNLSFDYVDRLGASSRRRVEPQGLLVQAPAWYLLAHDLDRDAARLGARIADPGFPLGLLVHVIRWRESWTRHRCCRVRNAWNFGPRDAMEPGARASVE